MSVKNRNKKFNFSDSWNEIYVIALSAIEENYKSVTYFIKFLSQNECLKFAKKTIFQAAFALKMRFITKNISL